METCLICCEPFLPNEENLNLLECCKKVKYHQECLHSWLLVKPTCPVCKKFAFIGYNIPNMTKRESNCLCFVLFGCLLLSITFGFVNLLQP